LRVKAGNLAFDFNQGSATECGDTSRARGASKIGAGCSRLLTGRIEEHQDRTMTSRHSITVNGQNFMAKSGETLLDAALSKGIDLPHDCRRGHCGTCCVRVVAGRVEGGEGVEPDVVHACQCRISGDVDVETCSAASVRQVEAAVSSLRPLSAEVMEVAMMPDRALPYLAGQYARVQFHGYPSRPYSFTHALGGHAAPRTITFHIRRMEGGQVTTALGTRIRQGHAVTLSGPFGSAHFRPDLQGRLILVATNTGFAPIWSVAVAALRENPDRSLMLIAGGRSLQSLYMGPALAQLARFPNAVVVPVCSGSPTLPPVVRPGRPTDYLPMLLPTDVIYACGAEGMVETVKAAAARSGAVCYADPFLAAPDDVAEQGLLSRAAGLLTLPAMRRPLGHVRDHLEPPMPALHFAETRVKRRLGS
jgi:NAD(P)H-flavin reductase/ferredoxin